MSPNGKFIVFEGIDGSGKTLQLNLLYDRLNKNNISVCKTKEPSEGEIGKLIRSAYLSGKHTIDQMVLTALFGADRLDHILRELNPLLNDSVNILSDRYYLSSLVYQGRLTSLEYALYCNKTPMELLTPDITVFIDIDPHISIQRINSRYNKKEIFETYDQLKSFREGYLDCIEILKEKGERFLVVDGSLEINELSDLIFDNILSIIG